MTELSSESSMTLTRAGDTMATRRRRAAAFTLIYAVWSVVTVFARFVATVALPAGRTGAFPRMRITLLELRRTVALSGTTEAPEASNTH